MSEIIFDMGNNQGIRCLRNGHFHRALCRFRRIENAAAKVTRNWMGPGDGEREEFGDAMAELTKALEEP